MQKVRWNTKFATAPKITNFRVFSLPYKGSFQLSLTVLIHYRSKQSYLGKDGGPPIFKLNFTSLVLLISYKKIKIQGSNLLRQNFSKHFF